MVVEVVAAAKATSSIMNRKGKRPQILRSPVKATATKTLQNPIRQRNLDRTKNVLA